METGWHISLSFLKKLPTSNVEEVSRILLKLVEVLIYLLSSKVNGTYSKKLVELLHVGTQVVVKYLRVAKTEKKSDQWITNLEHKEHWRKSQERKNRHDVGYEEEC